MTGYSKQDQLKPKTVIKYKTRISIADLKKKAQRVFNKWVRERDAGLPCISCQKRIVGSGQAGHYIAQGSSGLLRYNELNCHLQCSACNLYLHGNLIFYRINLVKKIGEDQVKWLEENARSIKKWDRQELEEIISKYASKTIR